MAEVYPVMGRRRFLNWLLGTSGAAFLLSVLYPVLRYVSPPQIPEASTSEVEVGPANDPELVEKGFKIVHFGAEPVIVVKVSDTEYRAFSASCTHLDCIVEFRKSKQVMWCNCHNGVYDLTGRNIAGPPPKPLTPFRVHLVAKGSGQPASLVVGRA
ncbi:MAG TPA: ubiquinol-cytochrome c reductase iron-sulfur subunit [Thermoanaerobaculia bacterium]|nr:ubiquinol-cytochrome c reductase iron-sulfur subunit [Thermoanaerobaculia bacterium]